MRALVKVDLDHTENMDLHVRVIIRGPEVRSTFDGALEASQDFSLAYVDNETPAERRARIFPMLNAWRQSFGLPVPNRIVYIDAVG